MPPRRRPPLLGALLLGLLALAAVGCAAGAGGPGWTFAPLGPSPQPTEPASPQPTDGEPVGNVIDLEMTQNLRYARDGQVIDSLELVVGEEYTFRVDNVAGFIHDIWFGPPDRLAAGDTEGLPGLPEWSEGVQEFSWTPTAEAEGWEFGCTVQGHYQAGMRGQLVLVDE
ncbi:MAG TPA: hypothetical protein VNT28_02550 [Candidatus Limnocylindrales bacterium]|jgi:hypothetical protein|nr:hypothetical protein [Candidatus Limnocylindrales bacterium]